MAVIAARRAGALGRRGLSDGPARSRTSYSERTNRGTEQPAPAGCVTLLTACALLQRRSTPSPRKTCRGRHRLQAAGSCRLLQARDRGSTAGGENGRWIHPPPVPASSKTGSASDHRAHLGTRLPCISAHGPRRCRHRVPKIMGPNGHRPASTRSTPRMRIGMQRAYAHTEDTPPDTTQAHTSGKT